MVLFYSLLIILLIVDYVGLSSIKGALEYRRKEKRSKKEKIMFIIEDFFLIILPILFTILIIVTIFLIEVGDINNIIK